MSYTVLTLQDITMGREREYPLTQGMLDNALKLLEQCNKLLVKYGKPVRVNSGYRPGPYNVAAGGSKNSSHLTCEAIDFEDKSRDLTAWILKHPEVLVELDLYVEEPSKAPTWLHIQTRTTKSGNRIFKP